MRFVFIAKHLGIWPPLVVAEQRLSARGSWCAEALCAGRLFMPGSGDRRLSGRPAMQPGTPRRIDRRPAAAARACGRGFACALTGARYAQGTWLWRECAGEGRATLALRQLHRIEADAGRRPCGRGPRRRGLPKDDGQRSTLGKRSFSPTYRLAA